MEQCGGGNMTPEQPHDTRVVRKAGIVVLRGGPAAWRTLLLRAYRNWGFPKGGIEAGEIPLVTALRETREEAALDDLEFRWGEVCFDTPPRAGHQRTRYYLAVSRGARVYLPVSAELGRPEHHEFRWTGFAAARQLLAAALHPVIDWAQVVAATAQTSRAHGEYESNESFAAKSESTNQTMERR